MGKIRNTRKLCTLGMLTAITTVLAIFGTIRIGNAVKIPLKFISVFLASVLFGPLWGGANAAVGDLLNAFLLPVGPWIPWLTATEFATGLIFGLFFYNKKHSGKGAITRAILCCTVLFFLDMFITTYILTCYGYFPSFYAGFLVRLAAGVVKFALHFVVMVFMLKIIPGFSKYMCSDFSAYANSFQAVTRPGLERIKALLDEMDNPQKSIKFIHIAGTNGKGSVASFLQNMLSAEGYKTGKYISPNLIKVNERVSIDGKDITDKELELLLKYTEQKAKVVFKKLGEMPTQFEIWTAVAFKYFHDKKCDFVVLETGLGGRLDATNIIDNPALCVITKIDFDHMAYLGNTLEKIAGEKAGIIKENSVVISAPQHNRVEEVLRNKAKESSSEIHFAKVPEMAEHTDIYEVFKSQNFKALLGIGGINQLENAAVSVLAAEKIGISQESIRIGLENAKNPARLERVGDSIIFDGGHNPAGLKTLVNNLDRYFPGVAPVFVMASMKDKDISENLKIIRPYAKEIRFVEVKNNERSAKAEELMLAASEIGIESCAYKSIKKALDHAENNLVVICGSLYLYKDFMETK